MIQHQPSLRVREYDPLCKTKSEHIKSVTISVGVYRIIQAENEPGNWLSCGRNYYEDRYSPLNQINSENVNRLGLVQ